MASVCITYWGALVVCIHTSPAYFFSKNDYVKFFMFYSSMASNCVSFLTDLTFRRVFRWKLWRQDGRTSSGRPSLRPVRRRRRCRRRCWRTSTSKLHPASTTTTSAAATTGSATWTAIQWGSERLKHLYPNQIKMKQSNDSLLTMRKTMLENDYVATQSAVLNTMSIYNVVKNVRGLLEAVL